ncbi:hypothetical protein BBP40_004939 [Aspergillus hancockii]|nr:hypothetical protein BBP40_004939 [Aspergillus hancockii]
MGADQKLFSAGTMAVPDECTVLVIGGGPAGSYAASVLAREGLSTVLLEADIFPRYHIGESMLPSMRQFLRFIDLESEFNSHGFIKKTGATFKLNSKPEAYTDFIGAGGPEFYAWNVIRSEADDLLFRHAGRNGAKIFDGIRVKAITFEPDSCTAVSEDEGPPSEGRPVSALWCRRNGDSGTIRFKYLVDATGRAGLISTKYMKNRKINNSLRAVATWGYWEGAEAYSKGIKGQNDPYFEAIKDGSGWVWAIPLHNNTMSVGVVIKQDIMTNRKREHGLSGLDLYYDTVKSTSGIADLLRKATLVSDIKSASDWSYSASCYATPYLRIIGDAGCFIDPFFSSGVHLALVGALSAGITICAAERGHCNQMVAANWHSTRVSESYTRFLLVVTSTLKQIGDRERPVLTEWDEDSFDRAFDILQPVIQGAADSSTQKLSPGDMAKLLDFCIHAMTQNGDFTERGMVDIVNELDIPASTVERYRHRILEVVKRNNTLDIGGIGAEVINGLRPNVEQGKLGLSKS